MLGWRAQALHKRGVEALHEREKKEMRDALDELEAGLEEAAGKGGKEDANAQQHIRALEARVEAHERQLQQKVRAGSHLALDVDTII